MKLITNGKSYTVAAQPSFAKDAVRYPLAAKPGKVGDTVRLEADTGMALRTDIMADWLRWYWDGEALVLTQLPETENPPPEPTEAELAAAIRVDRNARLADTDWTQILDAPIDAETQQAYRAYRQALRDIPAQAGFPQDVTWPAKPAAA